MAKKKPILGKKELASYGFRNKVQKNILNEIPQNWTPGARKDCSKCRGDLYTARIRMRVGKNVLVNTGNYNKDLYKTKQQLQIIAGQFCLTCGNFEEDRDFRNTRIKNLKKMIKDGWNKAEYTALLKEAMKD